MQDDSVSRPRLCLFRRVASRGARWSNGPDSCRRRTGRRGPAPTLSDPPDDAAQANATKLIHDLFGPQIDAAKTRIAKDELAKKLLQQGIDSKADPAGQFVLFKMARDLAVGVGDPAVALQSIDETARAFRIDAFAPAARNAFWRWPRRRPIRCKAARWPTPLGRALDDAIAADNFEVAKLLAAQGLAAAKRARRCRSAAPMDGPRQRDRRNPVGLRRSSALGNEARCKNRSMPMANLAVGRYRVFVKGGLGHGTADDRARQGFAVASAGRSPKCRPPMMPKRSSSWPTAGGISPTAATDAPKRNGSKAGHCIGTARRCRICRACQR